MFNHLARLKPKQDLKNIISVATEQRAGEHERLRGGAGQRAQGIPLGGIGALELMHLVGDGKIKETLQVASNEVDYGIASNLRAVRLPEGAIELAAGLEVRFARIAVGSEPLAQPHFLEICGKQALVVLAAVDWLAGVRIDHAPLISARL